MSSVASVMWIASASVCETLLSLTMPPSDSLWTMIPFLLRLDDRQALDDEVRRPVDLDVRPDVGLRPRHRVRRGDLEVAEHRADPRRTMAELAGLDALSTELGPSP